MLFLEMEKKTNFVHYFDDETRLQSLNYLAGIFEQLNNFNSRGQGPDTTTILQFKDVVYVFVEKIRYWNKSQRE